MTSNPYNVIEKLNYTIIGEGIDDFVNGLGVTTLRLTNNKKGEIELLRQAILKEKEINMVASPVIGDVYQDFYQKTYFENEELLEKLAKKIEQEIIREIYEKHNLTPMYPIEFKSRVIQHYAHNDKEFLYGIPPHYDHRAFVEVVVVLLLQGESLFHTALDKQANGEQAIDAQPMDLIVMRGYQFQGKDSRPVHYVKKIREKEGRTTLSFRVYSDNEEHLASMRKDFSKL